MKGQRSALIGDQILDCQDISSLSLRRPIDRGFIVNIDMQRDIWTRAFRNVLRVKPCDCGLVLTEPLFNLPAIRDSMAQVSQVFGRAAGMPSRPAACCALPALGQWSSRQACPACSIQPLAWSGSVQAYGAGHASHVQTASPAPEHKSLKQGWVANALNWVCCFPLPCNDTSRQPGPTVQVLFEDMGFQSVMTTSAANLALRKQWHRTPSALASQAGCGLVLDAGFSATHAIPVFDGNILYNGVRRLNLGGKVLTNYLKELVSYRWGRGAARQLTCGGSEMRGRGSTVGSWTCLEQSVSVSLGTLQCPCCAHQACTGRCSEVPRPPGVPDSGLAVLKAGGCTR